MDPETQALLQYLSTNFGLGAPVPNMTMAFADEPLPPSRLAPPTIASPAPAPEYRPDMNASFGAAGVPNPAGMPAEAVSGPSLGQSLQPEGAKRVPFGPVPVERPPTGYLGEKLRQVGEVLRPNAPPATPPVTPPMAGGSVPFPTLGFLTRTVQAPQTPEAPPPATYTPGPGVVPDQAPQTAQAAAPTAAGGNKLIDALRGVVAPKPPDVQRPIPHREAAPHKIESTIAMLAGLGITPKDLFHIPSLGQSLRG